ncbi:alpha/beta hydrolase family protein [Vreelandella sulfidaeris]|uniref:alpha/beta hydrolase family protein n=1 Tax=Vreelandella sulfidaeris TaxID=115553 RepID=UPI0035E9FE0F
MLTPSLEEAATPPERMAELHCTESALFWLERHAERGTTHLWRCPAGDMAKAHCLSSEESVGSRVNQYGGGSHVPLDEGAAWIRQRDQSLRYWQGLDSNGAALETHTWYTPAQGSLGGLSADPLRQRIIAVEERRVAGTLQRLIAIDQTRQQVLAEGADFYGAPAISPNGALMAWVEWSLPDMPWQRSRLTLAAITGDGSLDIIDTFDFGAAVSQPTFTADNGLIVMSDHAGWWQPWHVAQDSLHCLSDAPFDHITTPWHLGERQHTWGNQAGLCLRVEQGAARLYRITPTQSDPVALNTGRVVSLAQASHGQYVLAQGQATTTQLIKLGRHGEPHKVLRGAAPIDNPPQPETLSIPLGDGEQRVQGFLYPASQTAQDAPAPMIMRVHGGPTSACYPVYDPLIHYWVAQGFNVVDINPRGSGNFGRDYRQALHQQWGVLDTEDVETLTDALIAQGSICPRRCFIRGQSAGGFTVLNALAHSQRFLAGTSLYGVTDAVSLAQQTHRFESGYLDWLLGDETQKQQRSPMHTLAQSGHQVNVLLIQGKLDRVVVPEQAHRLARQLEKSGGRAEVLIFDNESHGMQNPQNRMTMIRQELDFYRSLSS